MCGVLRGPSALVYGRLLAKAPLGTTRAPKTPWQHLHKPFEKRWSLLILCRRWRGTRRCCSNIRRSRVFFTMRTPCTSRLKRRTIVQIDTSHPNDIPGRTRISHDVLECPHAQETKHPVPPRLTPWYVHVLAVLVLFTVLL